MIALPSSVLRVAQKEFKLLGLHTSDNELLRCVHVERGHGKLALTGTDLETMIVVVHVLEPEPETDLMRKLVAIRWSREACRFLVPFHLFGPSLAPVPAAPPVETFPSVLLPLPKLAEGVHRRTLRARGRVDVLALARASRK